VQGFKFHKIANKTSSNDKENNMTSTPVHSMKGVQDLIEVFYDKVTITPKGILGFMNKGLKGTKTIPFSSIQAIQFREAGAFISGYLQFTIPGGNESKGGVFSATADENTFMFAQTKNNAAAKLIKDFIEASAAKLRAPSPAVEARSMSDELKKLAALRADGILTDEEFQTAKKKLIG
jgi:hypothetical protein